MPDIINSTTQAFLTVNTQELRVTTAWQPSNGSTPRWAELIDYLGSDTTFK